MYKALVEAVKCGDTSIHSVDIHEQYDDVCSINSVTGKRKLIEQFEVIAICHNEFPDFFNFHIVNMSICFNLSSAKSSDSFTWYDLEILET